MSRGGPATLVVWRRDGKEITENSTYSTSQIIVDTSSITVYNNTLRVRGREGGVYRCTVGNSLSVSLPISAQLTMSCKWLYPRYFYGSLFMLKSDSPTPSNLTATYNSPSTVLLEWMFSDPVVGDTTYTVYYQSGGVSYNTSFTLTENQRSYMVMDLPLEVITNILLVAVTRMENHLPSPVVGPASLGTLLMKIYIAMISATVLTLSFGSVPFVYLLLQWLVRYQWSWLVQNPGKWVQSTPSPVQWLSPTELVTALSPSSGRDHPPMNKLLIQLTVDWSPDSSL